MISFDHIVIAVNDLETAARRYREDCGIAFQPGGVHPGGTKNWANLFPDGSYIELLAVNDAAVPSAALVRRFLERHGDGLFHWALRTDDIEAVAARTGVAVTGGSIDSIEGERQAKLAHRVPPRPAESRRWPAVLHPVRRSSERCFHRGPAGAGSGERHGADRRKP